MLVARGPRTREKQASGFAWQCEPSELISREVQGKYAFVQLADEQEQRSIRDKLMEARQDISALRGDFKISDSG